MQSVFNTLPYDIYERHRKVGSMIRPDDTVLDVGGSLNQLSRFCQASKITVANLKDSQEKSEIQIEKGKLPFKSKSFTTVCAIDVLEHIPKSEREAFVKDLTRISSQRVILSFPIGTQTHIKHEKRLVGWLTKLGQDVTYLREHTLLGLPTPQEVVKLTKAKSSTIFYSGNIMVTETLFKIHLFDVQIRLIRKIVYSLKLLFNMLTNPIFFMMLSNRKLSEEVVRAYVVIIKDED